MARRDPLHCAGEWLQEITFGFHLVSFSPCCLNSRMTWKLLSISGSHMGHNLATEVLHCLQDYQITNRVCFYLSTVMPQVNAHH
jgi:hypothetical protein